MKNKMIALLVVLTMVLSMASGLADSATTEITDLTTNYLTNPLGVELDVLRFGWKMDSTQVGNAQEAYQITITDPDGSVVWDSGLVASDLSVGISYEGEELALETRYDWTVAVTATDGNTYEASAYFETGADFSDVEWITSYGWTQITGSTVANPDYIAPEDREDDTESSGGGFVWGAAQTDTTSTTITTIETMGASAPLFRTEQALTGTDVVSARLYITSLGAYEAYINGVEVQGESNGIMAPGWTDYCDYINYQTYDVTDYIDGDTLTLAAIVGDGWYEDMSTNAAEAIGSEDFKERCLLAKLVINYADGSQQVIATDDETWVSSDVSYIEAGGVQVSEIYNAITAKELEGWNDIGYDVSDWDQTVTLYYEGELIPSDGGVPYEIAELEMVSAYSYDPDYVITPEEGSEYETGEMDPEYMSFYEAGDVIELKAGDVLVIDFGQNASAVPNITFSGEEGTTITITPAESYSLGASREAGMAGWDEDGDPYPKWTILDGASSGKYWYYIMSGDGEETFKSENAFVGYQYLGIEADADITVYAASSIVVSSIEEETGEIETSNDDVNQFLSNAKWSQLSNFVSVATDCPTREYNGWLGDIQVFIETGLYQYDVASFISNWITIMQRGFDEVGTYTQTMPTSGTGSAQMGWSDAGIIVPYAYYIQTGDTVISEKYWAEMSAYVDELNASIDWDSMPFTNMYSYGGWGDHLGSYVPWNSFLDYIFIYYDNLLMAEMAEALGYEEDAAKYSEAASVAREEFIEKYIGEDGSVLSASADGMLGETGGFSWAPYTYSDDAQTALAWVIKLGLYDTEEQLATIVANLDANVKNLDSSVRTDHEEYTIGVGFLGVNVLLPSISEAGLVETAFDLMMSTEENTFLYAPANADATTIWEEWVIWTEENGYGNGSQNHYAYGVAAEWWYEYVIGIQKDTDNPGFKHFYLQPEVDDSLDYAIGSYESYYGTIVSEWYAEEGILTTYKAVVPANTTATLYLPYAATDVETVEGATYVGLETHNGIECTVFELASGGYDFTAADGVVTVTLADGYCN